MLEIINNLKKEYNAHEVENSLLKDEYERDRETILQDIKDALNRKDIDYATSVVDKYYPVAEDESFKILSKEVRKRRSEKSSLEALITKYEITDKNKYQERYDLCNEILELDPANSKFKSERIQCEYALGLRKEVDSDLRLGRIKDDSFEGVLNAQISKFPFMNEKVIVRVHTHGISIKHKKDIYRIHHSQISSLTKDNDIKESIVAAVALGAIGYALGGIGDAIDGASAGLGSITAYLKIQYWNIDTSKSDVILIGFSNEKDVSKIINRYNKEIELTKRTHRPPKSEINLKRIIKFVGVLVTLIILLTLCSSPSETSHANQDTVKVEKQSELTSEAASPTPVEDVALNSSSWSTVATYRCAIKGSDDSTLIAHGSDTANAVIELSGTGISGCKTLSVKFDKKQSSNLSCRNTENSITINADGTFIKDMIKSSTIEFSIPSDSKQKKFKFSLMGFSKACEWAK